MTKTDEQLALSIRNEWFKNHKATIESHGPVTILDFKAPRTASYAIRYLFSENNVFITGDIGDAVFRLTWPAAINSFSVIHIEYFLEKLTAHSGDRWKYDTLTALDEFTEFINEFSFTDNEHINEKVTLQNDILQIIKNTDNQSEYEHSIYNYSDMNEFTSFDSEDFATIADFGKTTPTRFYAYLEGLKMASEQLNNQNKIEPGE